MIYADICAGISAATMAWKDLGWKAAFYSEIEPFPSAVLVHHYDTPNWGDMTQWDRWDDADINVLIGGTPCQGFSVAGLRKGLDDDRSNLALQFLHIADKFRPDWIVWENVPGVLSTNEGRDFGSFLGGLESIGYGWAYRTLDAQYFGLAQRRRRVFVVGYLGDWRPAAAVLFERESLQGHPAPRREKGQGIAGTINARTKGGGGLGTDFECDGGLVPKKWPAEIASTLNSKFGDKMGLEDQHALNGAPLFVPDTLGTLTTRSLCGMGARDVEDGVCIPVYLDPLNQESGDVAKTVAARSDNDCAGVIAHTLKGEGFDASEDGTGRGTPLVPVALAFAQNQRDELREMPVAGALAAEPGMKQQTYIAIDEKLNPHDNMMGTVLADHRSNKQPVVAEPFTITARGRDGEPSLEYRQDGTSNAILTPNGGRGGMGVGAIANNWAVRRLTPRECERLQGFPDDYTRIPWRKKPADQCPDGPRYKALGNSIAVPVLKWIGERIAMCDDVQKKMALQRGRHGHY